MATPAVVVVGAGVIGLTAAVTLAERGAAVTVISDRDREATTSRVAGAVWEPYLSGGGRVVAWAGATYRVLRDQAAAGVPGVSVGEVVLGGADVPAELPAWTAAADGVARLRPDQLRPGWTGGFRFDAPLVHMGRYLPWLAERAAAAGCRFERRHLDGLGEAAPADTVVHCAGLGAAHLAADPALRPVRGQVVAVANPGGLRGALLVDGPRRPPTYVIGHPGEVILGGSADEGATDMAPDPAVTARILADAAALEPALAGAEVIATRVGLRPWRPEVRLEEDPAPPPGIGRLVHDYGHGGSGVTLSWGCAGDVADLVLGSQP